jgi:hypothetical protein
MMKRGYGYVSRLMFLLRFAASPRRLFYPSSFILHPFLVACARVRRARMLAPNKRIATPARHGTKAARRNTAQMRKRDPNICS